MSSETNSPPPRSALAHMMASFAPSKGFSLDAGLRSVRANSPNSERDGYDPKKARLGTEHGRARLNDHLVRVIRIWCQTYRVENKPPPWVKKAAELKVEYGVIISAASLRDVGERRTWTHVPDVASSRSNQNTNFLDSSQHV